MKTDGRSAEERFNVLITGVGGQGTVLASRLLASAAMNSGYLARTAETIGMAQRGGAVTSHVRIGDRSGSAIIPAGKADLLIGFEPVETGKNILLLAKDGKCIVNTRLIRSAFSSYPCSGAELEKLYSYITFHVPDTVFVDGDKIAAEAGSSKALNTVLLGVALGAGWLPFSIETVEECIKSHLPGKYVELNLKALAGGYEYKRMN